MRERYNDFADQATEGARSAYNSAYNTARGYPGTIAAIVVGVGVAGFLIWAARRAGGWRNLQVEATDRARQGYDYAREGYGKARDVIKERVTKLKGEQLPEQFQ
ncbi:MAG TPA: hypothetical protein VM183_12575 [Burkholderiales bacterium]|nr:hypothetical protein [Burkholderiales bacterium]